MIVNDIMKSKIISIFISVKIFFCATYFKDGVACGPGNQSFSSDGNSVLFEGQITTKTIVAFNDT